MKTTLAEYVKDLRRIFVNSDGEIIDGAIRLATRGHFGRSLESRSFYLVRADGISSPKSNILLVGESEAGKSSIADKLEEYCDRSLFLGHKTNPYLEYGLLHLGKQARVFPLIRTIGNSGECLNGVKINGVVYVVRKNSGEPQLLPETNPRSLYAYLSVRRALGRYTPRPNGPVDRMISKVPSNVRNYRLHNITGRLEDSVRLVNRLL